MSRGFQFISGTICVLWGNQNRWGALKHFKISPNFAQFFQEKLKHLQFPQNMSDVPENFETMSHWLNADNCTTGITRNSKNKNIWDSRLQTIQTMKPVFSGHDFFFYLFSTYACCAIPQMDPIGHWIKFFRDICHVFVLALVVGCSWGLGLNQDSLGVCWDVDFGFSSCTVPTY